MRTASAHRGRKALVAIDVGTQNLKAVVADADMRLLGEASVGYRPSYPRPGWVEQDPALWLAGLRPAVGRALAAAGLEAGDIAAVGVTGQLDGCIAAREDGVALAPCIIWMDRRATAECEAVPAELVRRKAGLVRDASHMAAKIAWSRRNRPAVAEAARWHQPVSFLVEALCGRAVMDHALASTTMLYSLAEQDYAEDLLHAFGIERHSLPEIGDADAIAGTLHKAGAELTGLNVGTPVAVGTGDDFANAIGSGVTEPGAVACNIGTGEAIGAVSDTLLLDDDDLVETHAFPGGKFYLSNPGWLAGGAVGWFQDTFSVDTPGDVSALAASVSPGADGLLFLPALTGAMAPRWLAGARGTIFGLTPSHGRAACARGLLEGCAFAMRDVVDRLAALGLRTDVVRLTGGGAKSQVWAQIRADVSGRPVEYGGGTDGAPLGAAVLAAVAAGLRASVSEAAGPLGRDRQVCNPDPRTRDSYERAFARYHRLFAALSPIFEADGRGRC